ncbi:GxxExxY protein [Candidatus Falkowbacteria bacterium]|jgi:GxxExxY protein|nr:GxxExxY protein [Candidatus Falkowbacteria bacterium]MBT7007737.1 GxxExxY protein [Candidatus Falkowbacteria bacterium]
MEVEVLYKELSFEIVGVLFDVYNELGPNHPEKFYQKAVAKGLKTKSIKFIEQVYIKLEYQEERVGFYYLDFQIEDKIVLELKVKPRFQTCDYDQVKKYLIANNLKLGILATFTHDGVKFKRVLI